jgi:hypothetical protein
VRERTTKALLWYLKGRAHYLRLGRSRWFFGWSVNTLLTPLSTSILLVLVPLFVLLPFLSFLLTFLSFPPFPSFLLTFFPSFLSFFFRTVFIPSLNLSFAYVMNSCNGFELMNPRAGEFLQLTLDHLTANNQQVSRPFLQF